MSHALERKPGCGSQYWRVRTWGKYSLSLNIRQCEAEACFAMPQFYVQVNNVRVGLASLSFDAVDALTSRPSATDRYYLTSLHV